MHKHQLILRKLIAISLGFALMIALLAAYMKFESPDVGYLMVSWLVVCLGLSIVTVRWIVDAVQSITGFSFFFAGRTLILLYMLGAALSPVIIPMGIIVLVIRYGFARSQYSRECRAEHKTVAEAV